GPVGTAPAGEPRKRGYPAAVRLRATDVSADALSLATENAVAHGVADRIDFAVADLADLLAVPSGGATHAAVGAGVPARLDFPVADLADLLASPTGGPTHALLANLPYIPTPDIAGLPV